MKTPNLKSQVEDLVRMAAIPRSQKEIDHGALIEAVTDQLLQLFATREREVVVDFSKKLVKSFPYRVGDTGKKLAENNHSFNVASNLWKKHIKRLTQRRAGE